MAVPWGLILVVIGVVYGYTKPGKQDKWQIFKTGLFLGIVLGLLFALLGGLGGLVGFGAGFLGTLFNVAILTLLFIFGVWVGDVLE